MKTNYEMHGPLGNLVLKGYYLHTTVPLRAVDFAIVGRFHFSPVEARFARRVGGISDDNLVLLQRHTPPPSPVRLARLPYTLGRCHQRGVPPECALPTRRRNVHRGSVGSAVKSPRTWVVAHVGMSRRWAERKALQEHFAMLLAFFWSAVYIRVRVEIGTELHWESCFRGLRRPCQSTWWRNWASVRSQHEGQRQHHQRRPKWADIATDDHFFPQNEGRDGRSNKKGEQNFLKGYELCKERGTTVTSLPYDHRKSSRRWITSAFLQKKNGRKLCLTSCSTSLCFLYLFSVHCSQFCCTLRRLSLWNSHKHGWTSATKFCSSKVPKPHSSSHVRQRKPSFTLGGSLDARPKLSQDFVAKAESSWPHVEFQCSSFSALIAAWCCSRRRRVCVAPYSPTGP